MKARPKARQSSFDRPVTSDTLAPSLNLAPALEFARFWQSTSNPTRLDLVHRLAKTLAPKLDRFGALMATEIGKPARFGKVEGQHCLDMLKCIAGRAEGGDDRVEENSAWSVRRRPHGVVGVITPWNNPLYIALGKIVPAVVYGNAVVWKPAPEARGVSRALFECFAEAAWPDGLVTLVEGGEREGEALVGDGAIHAVTITGSLPAGQAAQKICDRRHVPLQAELGGNNAAIVWPDADLPATARAVARGAFEMAGQRCTANRRVVVHDDCRDDFMRLVLKESAALQWGDPLREDTDIGPLVSAAHRDRVAALVDHAALECGAPLLPLGPTPPPAGQHRGKFYPPTIICCDNPARDIVQEETFGPVLVVQAASTWDTAIELSNGVRQGLAAAIFSRSEQVIGAFLDEAKAGILKINQSTAGGAVDAPFGGWKASGVGPPEHGAFDIEFFTRAQTVYGHSSQKG